MEAVAGMSAARSVVMVVVAVVVARVVSVHPADLGEPCLGSGWVERGKAGSWFLSSSGKEQKDEVDTTSQHPPAVTYLTWVTLKEEALKLSTELGDALPQHGLPLPMYTCQTSTASCHSIASLNTSCTRVAERALCVAVGGVCQAVAIIIEEPISCCCGLESHNTTLTGKVTKMWIMNTCPPFSKSTAVGRGGGGGGGRGGGGLGERREEKKEHILFDGFTEPSLHEDLSIVENQEPMINNTTTNNTSQGVEGTGEMTEEHVKESSVLEDIIAALVFLFVGAVLMIIKSQLFRLTKTKKQEDRDVESEVTLVDETII